MLRGYDNFQNSKRNFFKLIPVSYQFKHAYMLSMFTAASEFYYQYTVSTTFGYHTINN